MTRQRLRKVSFMGSRRDGPRAMSRRRWTSPALGGVLLLAMTAVAYGPALSGQFIWDDDYYVQNNHTLRSAEGLREIWFHVGATPQYYPLVHTSFWIEYRLWGLNPAGYHAVNVLLHAVGAILLWRLLAVLEVPGAWAAAAIFALHPVHVESVAWITERKNVLSGVFYFGAFLAYLRFARVAPHSANPSPHCFILAWFLFLGALLSKTVTATLPAALLLVIWWKRGRWLWKDALSLLPFLPLALAMGLLTASMEKRVVGAVGAEWGLSFLDRCLIAGRALCFYAGKLIFPFRLAFTYPRWQIDSARWQQYLPLLAALLLPIAAWLNRHRLGKAPLVACLFFGGTLFPALGFFDVYPMRYSFVADHFQYLASVGLIALCVGGAHQLLERFGPAAHRIRTIAATLVLIILGLLTRQQTRVYADLETLWNDTLQKNPDAWMAHNNLGNLLREKGETGQAIEHIEKAMQHFRESVRLNPRDPYAYNNLAGLLIGMGRIDEAIEQCNLALRLEPNYSDAHRNLALALAAAGRMREAIVHSRESLRLRPDNTDVLNNLAWFLVTSPDPAIREEQEGLRLAERAAQLTHSSSPAVLDTLAAAYAATGQYDRAAATARRAVQLATVAGQTSRVSVIEARLDLYKQRRPYREPAAPTSRPPP